MYQKPQKCRNCDHYTTDHQQKKPKGVKPFRTECNFDNCECTQWMPGKIIDCVRNEGFDRA